MRKKDVLTIHPDYLFIYIGINDVWRDYEGDREEAVPLPDLRTPTAKLINGTRTNTDANIQLISPFLAKKDPEDSFRKRLGTYRR
jgi:lysophospholipase L1-like esterase